MVVIWYGYGTYGIWYIVYTYFSKKKTLLSNHQKGEPLLVSYFEQIPFNFTHLNSQRVYACTAFMRKSKNIYIIVNNWFHL